MAVSVIPPRFIMERIPVPLTPGLLSANVDMTHPTPGESVSNDDSWNGLHSRVLRRMENSAYMRHPHPPLTTGLNPDLIARAEFCVWQEMLIGQSLPSPAIQVQTWAFGFHYPHSQAIRCRQDKVQAHRFDISGANGAHGAHGQHGRNGDHGQNGKDGSYGGGDGSRGADGGHGQRGVFSSFLRNFLLYRIMFIFVAALFYFWFACHYINLFCSRKHVLLVLNDYQVATVPPDHPAVMQEMQFWSSLGHPDPFTAKST